MVRGVRLHVGLWEALQAEAEARGMTRNRYASERLREACEADRAERRRQEIAELDRERLLQAGRGLYG